MAKNKNPQNGPKEVKGSPDPYADISFTYERIGKTICMECGNYFEGIEDDCLCPSCIDEFYRF